MFQVSHLELLDWPRLIVLQRLKGAIDSRIAEEQARQRSTQSSPSRSNSTVIRSTSRTASPAVRPGRRPLEHKGLDAASKGLDPAEFDGALVAEEEDAPSADGTPKAVQTKNGEGPSEAETGETSAAADDTQSPNKGKEHQLAEPQELPPDVRVKLLKLEKLESRYPGRLHDRCPTATKLTTL
jgi:hypothetical protein